MHTPLSFKKIDNDSSMPDIESLASLILMNTERRADNESTESMIINIIDNFEEKLFLLIHDDNKTPVGYAYVNLLKDKKAEIAALFTAPPYRKNGIATSVLAHLKDKSFAYGCDKIYFTIYNQEIYTDLGGRIASIRTDGLQKLATKAGYALKQSTDSKKVAYRAVA